MKSSGLILLIKEDGGLTQIAIREGSKGAFSTGYRQQWSIQTKPTSSYLKRIGFRYKNLEIVSNVRSNKTSRGTTVRDLFLIRKINRTCKLIRK